MYAGILTIPRVVVCFVEYWWTEWRAGVRGGELLVGLEGFGHGWFRALFLLLGLFGDEAVWEEAEVLIVADDDVIEEVDVEEGAFVDFSEVDEWGFDTVSQNEQAE